MAGVDDVESKGWKELPGHCPVSYTHLDVYKRQGMEDGTEKSYNQLAALLQKMA